MVQKEAVAAAAVVTKMSLFNLFIDQALKARLGAVTVGPLCLLTLSLTTNAAVLPEDRADLMLHSYDGGGVTINGPSLLVRKNIADTVSLSANYYVDSISSASIDVETSGASRYTEERTEYSVTADYLYDKSVLSAGYTNSQENDYVSDTFYFGISQDLFGDLTTVSLGYARGNDTVTQNGNSSFEDDVIRQSYRIGVSQIATPSLVLNVNYEAMTDEGFLNNPYRSYRFIDPNNPDNAISQTEVYPRTRTSDAVAIGGKYFLPYRAAVHANYRYFTDDWDIKAHTIDVGYTHPIDDAWILDVSYRYYQQKNAYFYSDLHEFQALDDKDFRARDKELSQFNSQTLGLGISYEFKVKQADWIEKSSLNFRYDLIDFKYDNFRDIRNSTSPGDEPLYGFSANVFRVYVSIWY